MLTHCFEYLDYRDEDLEALTCTCKRFDAIITNVWKALPGQVEGGFYKDLLERRCAGNQENDKLSFDPTIGDRLWRRLIKGHVYSRRETINVHVVEKGNGRPAWSCFEPARFLPRPKDLKHASRYTYQIHVWTMNNNESNDERVLHSAAACFRPIQMKQCESLMTLSSTGLTAKRLAEALQSKPIYALQVNIMDPSSDQSSSAVLFSSRTTPQGRPLRSFFGGGDYEEYSALPWFEWWCEPEKYDPHDENLPRRNDWLPFCRLEDVVVVENSIWKNEKEGTAVTLTMRIE